MRSTAIARYPVSGSGSRRPGVAVVALVTAGLLVAGCGGEASSTTVGAASATPRPTGTATAPVAVDAEWGAKVGGTVRVGDVNLVAQSKVSKIKIYESASGDTEMKSIANPLPTGGPLVFLVQERNGDRLRVLLPIRPNGSQGWIRVSDVELSEVDYRITVSTKEHKLRLYQNGKLVLTEPVGLGKSTTPTPGGVFYLKELLKPTDPKGAYGPYAYGLSGYSDVLDEFLGGNGQIGIHGTNDPSSLGKSVSHGCIRMDNAAITKLTKLLPLGVPVHMI